MCLVFSLAQDAILTYVHTFAGTNGVVEKFPDGLRKGDIRENEDLL